MTKSSPSILAILLALVIALPSAAGTLRREETLNLPAEGLELLILGNGSGLLDCVGEEREDVLVELVFKAGGRSRDKAERLLREASLSVMRDADELRLKPNLPHGKIWLDMVVRIPRHLEIQAGVGSGELRLRDLAGNLDLEAGSGTVDARDIEADVDVKVGSGDIRLRDIEGAVRVQAGSGDLSVKRVHSCQAKASSGDLELHSIFGLCHAETGSGDIFVRKVMGPAEFETGSGDINASGLEDRLRSKSGSGDQTLRGLGHLDQELFIRATSGDLDLGFLPDASYRLELKTSSGDVDARIPMQVQEITRKQLEALIGRGETRARIETSTGDIRIRATEETP